MNARRDIDEYLAMWDEAQKTFPTEEKPKPKLSSFFGMQNDVSEEEMSDEDGEHWRDVFYRSLEIGGDMELVNEVKEGKKKAEKKPKKKKEEETPKVDDEEGLGSELADGPGKDVKFKVNPVTFNSVGDDSKLRVTPNWTDGDELRQLAKMKALLYNLESELLGTDVRGGDTEPIRVKLIAIQKQCESLSQKLIPDPKTDVS